MNVYVNRPVQKRRSAFNVAAIVSQLILCLGVLMPLATEAQSAAASASAPSAPSTPSTPAPPSPPAKTGDAPASGGNVYIFSGDVRTAKPINGDFIGFGGKVNVNHPVGGDVMVAGGSVDVRTRVGDDLRATGGDVRIESEVGGELLAGGGNVSIHKATQVQHDATLSGGSVTMDGNIKEKLAVYAQKIIINGDISGDVKLVGEQIELGPNTRIGGTLRYTGDKFSQADSAIVTGGVLRVEPDLNITENMRHHKDRWRSRGVSWVGSVFTFLSLFACGLVFLWVFPDFAIVAPNIIRREPWMALGLGFAVLASVPVLAILLCLTILGIPLGIVLMMLYPLILFLGYLVGIMLVAQSAQARMKKGNPATATALLPIQPRYMALGLLLVMLVSAVPWVGGWVTVLLTLAGTGAVVLHLYRDRMPRPPVGAMQM